MGIKYYAHSTNNTDKNDWQPLKSHLNNVAEHASIFAKEFRADKIAYSSGLLHDLGKYSNEFQERLNGAKIRVDHSTAGARESKYYSNSAQNKILEYIIAGHHTGLLNYGTDSFGLEKRINKSEIYDYSGYKSEINIPDINKQPLNLNIYDKKHPGFSISFYIRMLYSCLVDADFLDTELFLKPEKSSARGNYNSFDELNQKFNNHMDNLRSDAETNYINTRRNEIFEQCCKKADNDTGLFTLTVPTGGGKTLSSMAFALKHLKRNNLKRIFYVIPYTSIIEQNAKIFREIFGAENVLEHHSNFDPSPDIVKNSENFNTLKDKLKLSSENWDIPITITTNVQFFDSLFANRNSRCRKLHNLANSVIILDEAQMIPTGFLKPCIQALSELTMNYGSSVVVCTATQPKLTEILHKDINPLEIMDSPEELYSDFKRVKLTDIGIIDDFALAEKLLNYEQALCIVNTRRHAQALYDKISDSKNSFHLSARMCPVHRRKQIEKIKECLDKNEECRVISTQLIEAGVNIDFPVVYRMMAGMDSVCQAAGRCNREGKLDLGETFVFRSSEVYGKVQGWLSRTAEIGEMIIGKYEDPMALDSMEEYFNKLYFFEGNERLDKEDILGLTEDNAGQLEFPFEDIGYKFRLIKDSTKDIVIPCDDKARKAIDDIRKSGFIGDNFRKLQGYVVGVYNYEFKDLEEAGMLELVADRFYILIDLKDKYSNNTGLLNRKIYDKSNQLLIV